jgi:phage tail sheath protein FI
MPITPTYPGVYIEEIPSGVRTITGVATSITAFLGRTRLGPTNEPTTINSFGDFERQFGRLEVELPLGYAVRDFYLNGGSQAIIVRLYKQPSTTEDGASRFTVDGLDLMASSPGEWGKDLRVALDVEVSDEIRTKLNLSANDVLFNMTVQYGNVTERFTNLTVTDNARRVDRVLIAESNLVRWNDVWPSTTPTMPKVQTTREKREDLLAAVKADPDDIDAEQTAYDVALAALHDDVSIAEKQLAEAKAASPVVSAAVNAAETALATAKTARKGSNGNSLVNLTDIEGSESNKTGLYALDKVDLFNLLCIPPDSKEGDTLVAVYQAAMSYCFRRRAMLIVDSPAVWSANKETAAAKARMGLAGLGLNGEAARNATLYFPRVLEADPLRDGQTNVFVPCGIIAGVMARTDTARGVWKAPAGLDAAMNGIQGLQVHLNDDENGMLNPIGINCLRSFPVHGRVVWGARTLRGADQLADEYKYLSVRRTALFIEESLYRGTQWVVFEPNDEPLWAQIRLNVGAFMHDLFRQGAFQGQTPREAYLVKCDKETTTQNDINRGVVNILVGFAPLKPAEFVFISIQQLAGQIVT